MGRAPYEAFGTGAEFWATGGPRAGQHGEIVIRHRNSAAVQWDDDPHFVGGTTYPLPRPFVLLATQNPIEMEGTYPLPEAQLDRFLLHVTTRGAGPAELEAILDRTTQAPRARPKPVLDAARVLEMQALVR